MGDYLLLVNTSPALGNNSRIVSIDTLVEDADEPVSTVSQSEHIIPASGVERVVIIPIVPKCGNPGIEGELEIGG